jgi:enoyl-CoA hydratase/carnithine racemase
VPGNRVIVERDGHVAHVQLNRPEKRNAIDSEMFAELREAAQTLGSTPSVWAIVLSGTGHTFSAGLDMSNFAAMASGDVKGDAATRTARNLSPAGATPFQQVAWLWHEMPMPVIAAVEGHALGGGFHIALGADIRIIAPDAQIGFVEITWGLVPDMSGTQALRRLVPLDVAKRLIFTGEVISGREAVELGLGTMSHDEPVKAALEIAAAIIQRSPDALRVAKRMLNESALVTVAEGLANEVAASASLIGIPNQMEAVMARLEKRAPEFGDPTVGSGH